MTATSHVRGAGGVKGGRPDKGGVRDRRPRSRAADDIVVPEPLPAVPDACVLKAAAAEAALSAGTATRRSQRVTRVVASLGLAGAAGATTIALLTAQAPPGPSGAATSGRAPVSVTSGDVGTAGLAPAIEPPPTVAGSASDDEATGTVGSSGSSATGSAP